MSSSPPAIHKAVVLIAGPQKGTRFRPLSLEVPKPLFPVAGVPMVQHHVEALLQLGSVKEILLLGFYSNAEMADFVQEMNQMYPVAISYLQEYASLGTAGGIFHFRDRILRGQPEAFFVLHGDVCADFPLAEMLAFHLDQSKSSRHIATMLTTEATRQQSLNYGCVVEDQSPDHTLVHYVEKPTTYLSTHINCGVYVFSKAIFPVLQGIYQRKQDEFVQNTATRNPCLNLNGTQVSEEAMWIEKDILPLLASESTCKTFQTSNWWSQIKTAGSAIYANRRYLQLYDEQDRTERLFRAGAEGKGPRIRGHVFIHPTANIHPTAELGPNVSIGKNVIVGAGTRIKESIILDQSQVGSHSLIMYTVIGKESRVGDWARIEGTPNDPNPNKPFAKTENQPLFNAEGKLNPSITILGCNVVVPSEIIVLNSIILPHKHIGHCFKNEIML